MKALHTLIFAILTLSCASESFGLRSCDLAVGMKPMHSDSSYQRDEDVQFSVTIINQGPDTLFPTDTFYLTQSHDYAKDGPVGRKYVAAVLVPPGDSTSIETTVRLNPTKDLAFIKVTVLVLAGGPPPYPGKDYLERETSETLQDNSGEYRLAIKNNSSVVGLPVHKITVFPNPNATRALYVATDNESSLITRLYSSSGEYIQIPQLKESNRIVLDLSHLQSGTHILYLEIDEITTTEKVIVL